MLLRNCRKKWPLLLNSRKKRECPDRCLRVQQNPTLSHSLPSMRATLTASTANQSSALSASGYPVPSGPSPPSGELSANRAPSLIRKASYSYNKLVRENRDADSANWVHLNSGGSTSASGENDASLQTHAMSPHAWFHQVGVPRLAGPFE